MSQSCPTVALLSSDSGNNKIRLVSPDGIVTTLAGTGTNGFADGPSATAQFDSPRGVAIMLNGNIIVGDYNNYRIRLIFPEGIVTTIAGSGTMGIVDGPGTSARFFNPKDVAVTSTSNVIVAEYARIRSVDLSALSCTSAMRCNSHASSVSGTVVTFCSCTCSTGYTGATCDSCATYYTGYPTCTPIPCTNVTDCSSHASSVSGTLVSGCTCTCSTGYTGATCNSCATYYSSYPTCAPTPCSTASDCSSHASSVSGTLVSGCTCTCSTGYTGATCNSCATFFTGYPTCAPTPCSTASDCNGHASSVLWTSTNGCACTCSTGYGGATCNSCATYYSSYPTCVPITCSTASDCSNHASSVLWTSTSGCTCTCSTGYTGATCTSCAAYYTGYPTCAPTPCSTASDCNGHASSVFWTSTSGCTCTCSTAYSGTTCNSCATSYSSYPTCTPIPCTNATDCSGHASSVSGTLVSGCTCTCSVGYTGTTCNSCATNYNGYPICTPTPCTNASDCRSHASSVSGTLVSGCACTCSVVYGGVACNSCATNYSGYPTCTPTPCANAADCSGHALFVSGTLLSGCTCTCSTGFTGLACDSCATLYSGYPACTPTPCAAASDCSGHASSVSGTLVSGCTCTCSTGYSGATCSSCAMNYGGYPTCILSLCGSNVTLNSQPPAVKVQSLSLSPDSSEVTMVLGSKAQNSVVVVYQRDVSQAAPSRVLAGISRNDFNAYATCANASVGISVLADGKGTVTYSHAVNYTLCQQSVAGGCVVISCTFEIDHYVWLVTGTAPLMTSSEAPVVVRVPRALEQSIEVDRFTYQIFPGLLVLTVRGTTRIRDFTLVQSSSWLASGSMCALSTDALSITCVLQPTAATGQHSADFRVVFVNGEAIPANVSTHYVGQHVPNIFGRCVALHFTTTDLRYSSTEALVFLYQPFTNTTALSALLLVNAAGETLPVLEHSAPFNLICTNVPATNLTQCSFLPAAVHAVNRRFDASNPNLTLRATFSFEPVSNRRATEDVVVASGLTIADDEGASSTASSSHAAVIAVVVVVCCVGLLLVLGALVYVVMRRRAAAKDTAPQTPSVKKPTYGAEAC